MQVTDNTHVRPVRQPPVSPDLAVVIVSYNDGRWLAECLTSVFARAGGISIEAIVVDNESVDDTGEVVRRYPGPVRLRRCSNRGFGFGNNRGLEMTSARYVLFLNPDTEILDGTFADLIRRMDARPELGLVGVRQVSAAGELWPTIRRFPSALRALGEALGSERWPVHPAWAGERVLDERAYGRERDCDWTSGSFMLARREALDRVGAFDERFFLYCEEPDLCLRIKRGGWGVRHMPHMTILHHAGKAGVSPRLVAQEAFARRQYVDKHFPRFRRRGYVILLVLRHAVRALVPRRGGAEAGLRRQAAHRALRAVLGRGAPPFEPAPVLLTTDRVAGTNV